MCSFRYSVNINNNNHNNLLPRILEYPIGLYNNVFSKKKKIYK